MPNNVLIWNDISLTLSLTFDQTGFPLKQGEYWDVISSTAPPDPGQGTPNFVMWVNDNDGINDDLTYWWNIDVTLPDGTYLFTAQVQEQGDFDGCTKSVSTKRTQSPGEWDDPWNYREGSLGPPHVITVNEGTYEIGCVWQTLALGAWGFNFNIWNYENEEASQAKRKEFKEKVRALPPRRRR